MTIDKQPQAYTPVYVPNIFQLSSTNPNILNFNVQVLDAATNGLIANQKYQTLPTLYRATAFDLSSILSNLTAYQLNISNNLVEATPKILKGYKLNITENIISDGTITNGVTALTQTFKVWNADLNKVKYNSYAASDFVLQAATGATTVNYLTDKPDYAKVHYNSTEYLYLLNKDLSGYTISYKLYDKLNHYVGRYEISGSTVPEAFRVNASPKVFSDYFAVDISTVKYYTVQLTDLIGNPKTKLRFYQYQPLDCKDEPVELVFANSLGGFDSFTFFNPKNSIQVSKTKITKYPWQIVSGNYSNISGNVFLPEEETINVDTVSTYTVISQPLKDADSTFLKQVIQSPEVYLKLADGTFLPVSITNTSYQVGRAKFSNGLVRMEVQFTAPTGIDIINNNPYNNNYAPPNIPYVEVESFCYGEDDSLSFGYVEPDSDGDAIIEDGQ